MNSNPDKQDKAEQVDLIGYRLGLLDRDEAACVAAALRESPELQAEHEALAETLAPLSMLEVEPAGAALVRQILDRVNEGPPATLPFQPLAPVESGEMSGGGGGVSWRELVGLAAAIALFVGVFIPAYQRQRTASQRVLCMDNLRQIGAAETQYAAAFGGVLPFAGGTEQPWLAGDPAGRYAPNSRHPYLMVKGRWIPPHMFVCPGRPNDRPMSSDAIEVSDGFPELCNVSYSTPALSAALRQSQCVDGFPLIVDQNPQFPEGKFSPREHLNADSHGYAAGQNVARDDGSVIWTDSTRVGPGGDDIMRLNDVFEYHGFERMLSVSDAMLAP